VNGKNYPFITLSRGFPASPVSSIVPVIRQTETNNALLYEYYNSGGVNVVELPLPGKAPVQPPLP
jgi:hypothetical protein